MHEITLLIFILVNLPVLFFYKEITKKLSLYDYKDGTRKFQKNPVPLTGGILLIYNILVFTILNFSMNPEQNFYGNAFDTREYFSFFVGLIMCFFLGVYDDKFNLTSMKKLLINLIIIFTIILADENLVITELSFSFLDNPIELRNLSYFFSILCFLLLINALNMFDGINLQTASYCLLILSIFIYKDLYVMLSFVIILTLIRKMKLPRFRYIIAAFICLISGIEAGCETWDNSYLDYDEIVTNSPATLPYQPGKPANNEDTGIKLRVVSGS